MPQYFQGSPRRRGNAQAFQRRPQGGGGGGQSHDPAALAVLQSQLQQNNATHAAGLQAELQQIELTDRERRRMNLMREQLAGLDNDPNLTPEQRQDLRTQLISGLSPLQARYHQGQILAQQYAERRANDQHRVLMTREAADERFRGMNATDRMEVFNDPQTGQRLGIGVMGRDGRYQFIPHSAAGAPEPAVNSTAFGAIRDRAMQRATEILTPPTLARGVGAAGQPTQQEQDNADIAYRGRMRMMHGIPNNMPNFRAEIDFLANRFVQEHTNAINAHANPDQMAAQQGGTNRAYQAASARAQAAAQAGDHVASQRFLRERDAIGSLGGLLSSTPMSAFSHEQRAEFQRLNSAISREFSEMIQLPGQPPPPPGVRGPGAPVFNAGLGGIGEIGVDFGRGLPQAPPWQGEMGPPRGLMDPAQRPLPLMPQANDPVPPIQPVQLMPEAGGPLGRLAPPSGRNATPEQVEDVRRRMRELGLPVDEAPQEVRLVNPNIIGAMGGIAATDAFTRPVPVPPPVMPPAGQLAPPSGRDATPEQIEALRQRLRELGIPEE